MLRASVPSHARYMQLHIKSACLQKQTLLQNLQSYIKINDSAYLVALFSFNKCGIRKFYFKKFGMLATLNDSQVIARRSFLPPFILIYIQYISRQML
jgi:hypothetical protein